MTPYYESETVKLWHADNREILPTLPADAYDVAVTSPPYNLREGMEDKGGLRIGHKGSLWAQRALADGYDNHSDDLPYPEYVEQQKATLRELWRVVSGAIYYNHKPRIVKGQLRTPLALTDLPVRQIIIWDRGSGMNFMPGAYCPQHEWIVLMAKPGWTLKSRGASGVGDVWTIPPDKSKGHPASFPLAIPERALETSGATSVIDPWAGSGTTLLAAKRMGIKAVGIEKSEAYCEITARRLSQEMTLCSANDKIHP